MTDKKPVSTEDFVNFMNHMHENDLQCHVHGCKSKKFGLSETGGFMVNIPIKSVVVADGRQFDVDSFGYFCAKCGDISFVLASIVYDFLDQKKHEK